MTTSGETAGRDPLALLEEIRANVAAAEGMALPMEARRMRRHVPRLLAGYDALLELAAEFEAKSAELWGQIAGLPESAGSSAALRACSATAYKAAASRIRAAIAAALSGEEAGPS